MPPSDAVAALTPALAVGERVSLRVNDGAGRREVIGFVTRLSDASVSVVDRRGVEHALSREAVEAARRVGVALGRRPDATPRDLLDALAARAGASGTPGTGRAELAAGLLGHHRGVRARHAARATGTRQALPLTRAGARTGGADGAARGLRPRPAHPHALAGREGVVAGTWTRGPGRTG